MKKGYFISFEGGEGCGKSTQITLLSEALKNQDIETIVVREPGSTIGAEHLRSILKDTEGTNWDAISQTLILYAARRDLVEKVIKPALSQGKWVLCDRFSDSTFVYQGHTQSLGIDYIRNIHEATLKSFEPDLTFFLDLPPEEGMKRAKRRSQNDFFEEQALAFHEKVYEGYKMLAHRSKRILTVPGTHSISHISDLIQKHVAQAFQVKG